MSRLLLFVLIAATLAGCSEAGPYGYGYAVNDRPSLAQLGIGDRNAGNSFAAGPPQLTDATAH